MKSGETVVYFQDLVSQVLIRHRSILDCLTKFQESTARVNRSIIKTVTNCGCISINAGKQQYPNTESLKDCSRIINSHLKGELCEHCREIISEEIGNHLFYLTAMCDLLGYDLSDIINAEKSRINTLGHFLLS